VVEGAGTKAREKIALFDRYLGVPAFVPGMTFGRKKPRRGLRIQALHDLPEAIDALYDALEMERDYRHHHTLRLNPWLKNMGKLGTRLPPSLVLSEGNIPTPYREQIERFHTNQFGRFVARRNMRSASHASSNDGAVPRVYGHSLLKLMEGGSLADALILGWTGHPPAHRFEAELVEQLLIASFTNGPGTISAQAAKLSASAGNSAHVAMIATLSAVGSVHGGNAQDAVAFLVDALAKSDLADPYDRTLKARMVEAARETAAEVLRKKRAADEQDLPSQRVPCLGHPVYHNKEVNYEPRERVIAAFLEKKKVYHAFLHFYHELTVALRDLGITRNVLAVNIDAAIACVWLGICWPLLREKKMTVERAKNIVMAAFALGRAAGGAAEYLDHTDFGMPMDMRIPVDQCIALTPPADTTHE
jgi:citrate synthase